MEALTRLNFMQFVKVKYSVIPQTDRRIRPSALGDGKQSQTTTTTSRKPILHLVWKRIVSQAYQPTQLSRMEEYGEEEVVENPTLRAAYNLAPLHQNEPLHWNYEVNLIGEKMNDKIIHLCEVCELPILVYGRMLPCKHIFCFDCARKCDKYCKRCENKVQKVEKSALGTVYVCTHGAPKHSTKGCRRTYLSQRDLQSHISHRHLPKVSSKLLQQVSAASAQPVPNQLPLTQQQAAQQTAQKPPMSVAANTNASLGVQPGLHQAMGMASPAMMVTPSSSGPMTFPQEGSAQMTPSMMPGLGDMPAASVGQGLPPKQVYNAVEGQNSGDIYRPLDLVSMNQQQLQPQQVQQNRQMLQHQAPVQHHHQQPLQHQQQLQQQQQHQQPNQQPLQHHQQQLIQHPQHLPRPQHLQQQHMQHVSQHQSIQHQNQPLQQQHRMQMQQHQQPLQHMQPNIQHQQVPQQQGMRMPGNQNLQQFGQSGHFPMTSSMMQPHNSQQMTSSMAPQMQQVSSHQHSAMSSSQTTDSFANAQAVPNAQSRTNVNLITVPIQDEGQYRPLPFVNPSSASQAPNPPFSQSHQHLQQSHAQTFGQGNTQMGGINTSVSMPYNQTSGVRPVGQGGVMNPRPGVPPNARPGMTPAIASVVNAINMAAASRTQQGTANVPGRMPSSAPGAQAGAGRFPASSRWTNPRAMQSRMPQQSQAQRPHSENASFNQNNFYG